MKKLIIISLLTTSAFIVSNNLMAEENKTIKERNNQNIGFVSGLVIGAVSGGPVGAIIGAVSGVWLGEKVNEADKVEPLTAEIAKNENYVFELRTSLAKRNQSLDRANLIINKHQAEIIKVSQRNELISGLQIDLMFRSNSWALETGAVEKIAPLVLMLEQFPQLELSLTGHGDVSGTAKGNKEVAYQRTLKVKQAFIQAGIEQQRVHLIISGRTKAEAVMDDVDGRALDRRVRIQFVHTAGKPALALK